MRVGAAQKYRALMNFLSNVLREDGGFEYKKAIVDSILILIREIPDAKESGLSHLCEFIEARPVCLALVAVMTFAHSRQGLHRLSSRCCPFVQRQNASHETHPLSCSN